VTPEEASEPIKEIYENIRKLLGLQEVPEFFQKLAVKENVLTAVWELMSEQWQTSKPFEQLYEQTKEKLNAVKLNPVIGTQSIPAIDKDTCQKLSNQLEEYAKVWLVVILLLHGYLTGYLKKYEFKKIEREKLKLHVQSPHHKANAKQLLNAINQSGLPPKGASFPD
jgi:ethanolamine utilization cobalamin adenosyltransferase